MIPVKITQRIYIRKGPGRSFGFIGIANPGGITINMEGKVSGESVDGIGDWYFKTNNNGLKQYYWGGGIATDITLVTKKIIGAQNSGNSVLLAHLGVDQIWASGENGDMATVAVLDSGISVQCKDLTDAVAKGMSGGFENASARMRNFVADSQSINDDLGHGSHCAGLIASRNTQNLVGIATGCRLYVGKITDAQNSPSVSNMISGIGWAAGLEADSPQDIDIISMSCGSLLNMPDMQPVIDAALKKGKILVFSIGNRDPGSLPEGGNYPALCSGVVSVGSVDMSNDFQSFSYEHPGLTIACPGAGIVSYWIGGALHTESGTSQSNAICAGVIALLVSRLKKKGERNIPGKIMELLLSADTRQADNGYTYRYIDPLKLFNAI